MKRFKSAGQAQRFLSAHDQISNLFHSVAITSALPSTKPPECKLSRSARKSAVFPQWHNHRRMPAHAAQLVTTSSQVDGAITANLCSIHLN